MREYTTAEVACIVRTEMQSDLESFLWEGARRMLKVALRVEVAEYIEEHEEARSVLVALRPGLKLMNQSALNSLEEGLDETLTLHRLGLMPLLQASFRTTNCIENVNSLIGQLTHNVRRWTNSSQRHRWVATALLDIQPRLRRVKGHNHLPLLRQAIQAELGIKQLAMTG